MKHFLNNQSVKYKYWMKNILQCKVNNINPENNKIFWGYCACGCGNMTNIAATTNKQRKIILGESVTFISGHNSKYHHNLERPLKERFWEKVNIQGENDCWEWKAFIHPDGYGIIRYKNKSEYAHRISYELAYGKIPEGMFVCHICDNPICVNPNHLFLGTQKDNMQDMINKNRNPNFCRENNPASKLYQNDIDNIKNLYFTKKYNQYELADMYNVTQANISKIIRNQTWKE